MDLKSVSEADGMSETALDSIVTHCSDCVDTTPEKSGAINADVLRKKSAAESATKKIEELNFLDGSQKRKNENGRAVQDTDVARTIQEDDESTNGIADDCIGTIDHARQPKPLSKPSDDGEVDNGSAKPSAKRDAGSPTLWHTSPGLLALLLASGGLGLLLAIFQAIGLYDGE
eukprot:CAMPEP_0170182706 /NCGR_PEP_ID=MMETSP0040_2-20121228/28667_1 /TAXON_ID=641309 /ORGANISM="Lotharella oceanica, Strain CCMP622" /LENGTH=172 /DNA_ID=CAMNT_0010428225 /DNA_START=198 /DNA_END=717 /DNA_ORIENTATION=-